ncbi:MAG: hypothetical protein ACR2RF_26260 [Geminicoccaceae bacterium]
MTPQQKMKAMLAKTGIPHKEIECYGSQIVITSWSEAAARKWASLLANFATVRGIVKTTDYNKDQHAAYDRKIKRRGVAPSIAIHDVWRTFAAV